ncbi:hypothetical protein ACI2LJ_02780 [Streptomyces sp. NPDC088090]|uniref:hypothetical protein n=1 Tax=Streptomyces sp. NPDC088090 TaxID=3365822 RepID=UPI00384ADD41
MRPDLRLRRGRVVEAGPHEELPALGGTYAGMFALQAGGYRGRGDGVGVGGGG